jgi:hypothetical protein
MKIKGQKLKAKLKVQKIGDRFLARDKFEGQIDAPCSSQVKLSQDDQTPPVDSNNDYVYRTFRAISNVIIRGLGYPLDCTDPSLFKDVKKFWQSRSLFKDHLLYVDNCVGLTKNPVFNKKSDPIGLDVDLWVDRKLDDKTARRVETGAIDRCSVTMSFYFRPSHDIKDDLFWDSLGEIVDGEEVRLIMTEVEWIRETSLVWFGADETAQDHESIGFSQKQQINHQDKEVSKMKDLIQRIKQKFAEFLGKTLETDLDVEQAVLGLMEKNVSLEGEKAALEKKVRDLQKAATFEKSVTDGLREEVLAIAKTVNTEGVPEIEQSVIQSATYEQLVLFKKDYDGRLDKMFPFVCQDCGKSNVARRSSIELVHQEGDKPNPKGEAKAADDEGDKYYG